MLSSRVDVNNNFKLKSGRRCLSFALQILMACDRRIHYIKISATVLYKMGQRLINLEVKKRPILSVLYDFLQGIF